MIGFRDNSAFMTTHRADGGNGIGRLLMGKRAQRKETGHLEVQASFPEAKQSLPLSLLGPDNYLGN